MHSASVLDGMMKTIESRPKNKASKSARGRARLSLATVSSDACQPWHKTKKIQYPKAINTSENNRRTYNLVRWTFIAKRKREKALVHEAIKISSPRSERLFSSNLPLKTAASSSTSAATSSSTSTATSTATTKRWSHLVFFLMQKREGCCCCQLFVRCVLEAV